ncbi:PLDc N-terminal domain-containing protein [Spirosoma soli]|uniref:PLDc N-terminal domain-containing protein n=1 Tax=Spirosoma soli TaxID=1770529 RepID=A0ABW5M8H2_9BACT
MYTFMGLGGQELLIIFIALGVFTLLPIIALVDVIRSDFRGSNDKLIWVLVILFLNLIGALLYLIIGRNQRIA